MKSYTKNEKEQILKEVKETGNMAVVARKHNIPTNTIHGWVKKEQQKDSKTHSKSLKELEKQLADKELENKILKDLLKKTNQAWLKD